MPPLYLDHHASTPVDPRAAAAMAPFIEEPGNAASGHAFGRAAARAVDLGRADVASLLGCDSAEVVFTSGATESDNQALQGVLRAGDHLITTAIEHSAILETARALAARGVRVSVAPVGRSGIVQVDAVAAEITPRTRLVSVMLANNEVGTVQPIPALSALCRGRGILFHVDACQGVGRVPFAAHDVDLASVSGHKVYGPQGIGALYVRQGVTLAPLLHGGHADGGLRPGTLNVAGIVGLGIACAILRDEGPAENARLAALRDDLLSRLHATLGDILTVNGSLATRLPGNLHVTLLGVCPIKMAAALDGLIAVSSASACHTSADAPVSSHVLAAMGAPGIESGAPLRFGLGRSTTPAEIAYTADVVTAAARRLHGTGCE